MVFIDDILKYSMTQKEQEHEQFWLDRMAFLRHVVFVDGILMDLSKIEAILEW